MSAVHAPEPALGGLRRQIEAENGPLAEALVTTAVSHTDAESFATLVARGERASRLAGEYGLLVESILEGYLLHYGCGRILRPSDHDLRLLAGDYLYAFGLARLARIGDLEAVEELADLISLCAQAHATSPADSKPDAPWRLTRALWALAALAVGGGRWPEQDEAKRLARAQGTAASEHLIEVATAQAQRLGLVLHLRRALIAFEAAVGDESGQT